MIQFICWAFAIPFDWVNYSNSALQMHLFGGRSSLKKTTLSIQALILCHCEITEITQVQYFKTLLALI